MFAGLQCLFLATKPGLLSDLDFSAVVLIFEDPRSEVPNRTWNEAVKNQRNEQTFNDGLVEGERSRKVRMWRLHLSCQVALPRWKSPGFSCNLRFMLSWLTLSLDLLGRSALQFSGNTALGAIYNAHNRGKRKERDLWYAGKVYKKVLGCC